MYCICQQVHWIYHQVYCISYHVNKEPHLVYCISQQVYCICHLVYCICHHLTSGATMGCTTLAIKCAEEAMLYFRSPTWVFCICHHVHQEPHLGVLHILSCKSGAPTGVLHMPSCTCTSGASLGCTVFSSRCTGFTIKCTAEAIMYIRSLAWMYCISYHVNQEPHLVYTQVYCICHHVHREPHLGVLH